MLDKYCGVFKFAIESKSERVNIITIDCLMVKLFLRRWLGLMAVFFLIGRWLIGVIDNDQPWISGYTWERPDERY